MTPTIGLDILGVAAFSKDAINAIPTNMPIGAFSNTFGDALPHVEQVLSKSSFQIARLHPMWHDNHAFLPSDYPTIIKECQRIGALKQKFPNANIIVSTGCEHNYSAADAKVIYDKVVDACPGINVVNSPMSASGIINLPGYTNEFHGTSATIPNNLHSDSYCFSFDGNDCVDANVEAEKQQWQNAGILWLWSSNFNGRAGVNDPTPRDQRKAYPSPQMIQAVAFMATSKGATHLPAKWIWKCCSEYSATDSRSQKPVCISPVKSSAIVIKTSTGVLIDTMAYYGTYSGGGYRYYSRTWGYQTAQKAIKLSGNPVCQVWQNNKHVGDVNCGFRENSWR